MIRIEDLCKTYDGEKVLNHFNLLVPKGSVYGLMGLNGAGKTTVIRHLSGFVRPDSGRVTVDGQPVDGNEKLKERLVVIPDDIYFFRGYSMKDMRAFCRKLYSNWDDGIFSTLAEDFGMNVSRSMNKFSKGMKKQAAFCLAMAARPDYLILDEPVDGIDPIARKKLWRYIMGDVAEREMTVLISSHNAREMSDVCDTIGLIAGGKMIFEGNLLDMYPETVEELFNEKLGGEDNAG